MAVPNGEESKAHRWVIVAVLLVLVVIGLVSYGFEESDERAEAKADQLIAALQVADLPTPENRDTITRVLGNDGGPVCEDPGNALRRALLNASLVNGAAFVGQRPIRAERNLLEAQLLVLEIYCPDELEDLREHIDDYRVDDVSKN